MLNGPQCPPGLTSITARDAYRTFAQSTDRNRRCAMAGAIPIEVRSPLEVAACVARYIVPLKK